MTDRKMSGEEVFVSAMNAAISGFITAKGDQIIERAKQQNRVFGDMSDAINAIVLIVELASHAGFSAVQSWNEFSEESDG